MLAPASENLHKCGVCQKKFSQHSHLKTHMLIHTGTGGRPHKCDICEEVFYLLSVAVLRDGSLNMLMASQSYVLVTSHLLNIAVLHTLVYATHIRFTIMHAT